MTNKSMTTLELKKMNQQNVYRYIYQTRQTSKQDIAYHLNMGLTTVTQNLKNLEDSGLIQKNGFYESTGGRKANAIEIVKEKWISLGVEILKERLYIVAIDLYGDLIMHQRIEYPFVSSLSYCQEVGKYIDEFVESLGIPSTRILGVSLILQGIIDLDGKKIIYSPLLGSTTLNLDSFQQYISFPCHLEHDSKAAAYLECWHNEQYKDAIVLLLNQNLGSAIVIDGKVHKGLNVNSGLIEHMVIKPDGETCYCGKRGCLETLCSAEALSQKVNIEVFFKSIRDHETTYQFIWNDYLYHLAKALHYVHSVLDVPIIISGYLAAYITNDDLENISSYIQEISHFTFDSSYFHISQHGFLAPAIGGALYYVDSFLKHPFQEKE